MTDLTIRKANKASEIPFDLLLLADPSREIIKKYLMKSQVFIAESDGKTIGCYVLAKLTKHLAEIKNIVVDPQYQKRGFGSRLIQHAYGQAAKDGYTTIRICTGNSSIDQLRLYQSHGFQIVAVIENHFTQLYPEPIFENGIPCTDQMVLEKLLNKFP